MTQFHLLLWSDEPETPVAIGGYDPSRTAALARLGRIEEWTAPTLSLSGEPTDYLANDAGLRLCSAKLREIIDSVLGPDDDVQWLGATVTLAQHRAAEYSVLHLPTHWDVLDPHETTFATNDVLVKPVLSIALAGSRHVFAYSRYGPSLVISEDLAQAITAQGCSGVHLGVLKQV